MSEPTLHLIYLNQPGEKAARRLLALLPNQRVTTEKQSYKVTLNNPSESGQRLADLSRQLWCRGDALLYFAATGIVVRTIAPLLKGKESDPAVLITSFDLRQIVPLLGGHLGGANAIGRSLQSHIPGSTLFLTTASDQLGQVALDLFAAERRLTINDPRSYSRWSNARLNGERVTLIAPTLLLDEWQEQSGQGDPTIEAVTLPPIAADKELPPKHLTGSVALITPSRSGKAWCEALGAKADTFHIGGLPYSVGIGCHHDASVEQLETNLTALLDELDLPRDGLLHFATFDGRLSEPPLPELARRWQRPLLGLSRDKLNSFNALPAKRRQSLSASQASRHLGVPGVSEVAAILTAPCQHLVVRKRILDGATFAIAV